MVHGEAHCALRFLVAFDEHVAGGPARIPGGLVLGEHGAPAQRTAARERGDGVRSWIILQHVGARHRDEAVEFGSLPGDGSPAPSPSQRERTLGDERIVAE